MIKVADLAIKKKDEEIKATEAALQLSQDISKKYATELERERDQAKQMQHDPMVTVPVGAAIGIGIVATPLAFIAVPVIIVTKLLSK